MGAVRVVAIRPEDINEIWSKLKPYIEMALDYSLNEQSAEDVRQKGINGVYLYLVFYDGDEILGVITVETFDYPNKRIVGVVHVGGKRLDDWLELMWDTVRSLAIEQGASEVISYGRQGWIKKLKKYGFKLQYTVLSVTL